jgi:hypothetical protein
VKTFKFPLPVGLTVVELTVTSDALAAAVLAAVTLEADQADARKAMKENLEEKWFEVSGLARTVREKTEVRQVECSEQPDYTRGLVSLVRLDTLEVVSSRMMKDDERNVPLFDASEGQAAG